MSESRSGTSTSDAVVIGLTLVAVLALVGFWLNGYLHRGIKHPRANSEMQTAHMLVLALFSYENDHAGKYPTGKSSTEVFQTLLDEKYISDPTVFYSAKALIPGKFKATSSKLLPANVCWDVTVNVDSSDPDELPLVFWTGFRMNYVPGGAAIPLSPASGSQEGLAIAFKNNGSMFRLSDRAAGGIVRDVVPPTFVLPAGKKYLQLTPDGPLVP